MLGEVERVVGPALHGDDRDVGPVAGDDREQLGEARAAGVLDDDDGLGEAARADHEVAVDRVAARAIEPDADRLGELGVGRQVDEDGPSADPAASTAARSCGGRTPRSRASAAEIVDVVTPSGRLRRPVEVPGGALGQQSSELLHRGEAPLLLAAGRQRERRDVERRRTLGARLLGHEPGRRGGLRVDVRGGAGVGHGGIRVDERVGNGHQPTAPSIWSSMRRLSSRAYSIGSSRAIGSMKPRTIIAMASSSAIPRDMR